MLVNGVIIFCQCDIGTTFVTGDDEQSTKLVESFDDASVSQLIISANCVALRLPVKRLAVVCCLVD